MEGLARTALTSGSDERRDGGGVLERSAHEKAAPGIGAAFFIVQTRGLDFDLQVRR